MGHAGWGADTLKAKAALSAGALLALVDSGQEVIRCNFTTLAADAAAALGRRLVERGTVRSLDLCYCELGALGVEALAASLARPSGLRQLSLGANAITARGAVAAVSIATGLRRLDLEINQLGDEGCKLVAQKVLLRVTTTLQHLDLGMNSIGPDGALALASALRKNMALTRLDLGYNRIGSVGAEALAQALMGNTALKVLRLEDNAVGDLGATALVSGATRLQELELAFNQVRAEGAVAVAAALRSPTELRRLGLRGNELRDAGASALAAAISKNCGLQDLSLQSNAIGSAGGSALVQALRGNWRLTALDVTENAITQEAATSIAEMTRQARVVHEEALRPPSSRDLAEGTQRRFPTEWSVRAWLGWISKDGRESDIKTLVSVSHAAAVMAAEAAVLSYDLARLRDLASIYGRRLAPAGRQKEAAKGVYLLNLTPFCIQVTVGKSSKAVQMKENSGALLGPDAATLRLTLSAPKDSPVWLPQTLSPIVVTPIIGEQVQELPDAGDLRVLSSRWRAEESSHAQLITLLWSWPQRLRGIRFHDLSFWWQGARVAMQGGPADVKSAIARAVLPDTALAQSSLAELYNPGPVQTFVSHHWGQDVDELFKSLSHCSMRSENTRLWICAFSNNHWSPPRDNDCLCLAGAALASRSCHSFALVLGSDAQSLRRLWCLHETVVATNVRRAGRPLALKLCSPHGLLSEGTGGMPISYILKVSGAISTLDLQSAESDSAEKDMLLNAAGRLMGSVTAANSLCRKFLQDGLSGMHQRGQQIFVQAVSWLSDTKLEAQGGITSDATEKSAVTGAAADAPAMQAETPEVQSRAASKTSSHGEQEVENAEEPTQQEEAAEEEEVENPAAAPDAPDPDEEPVQQEETQEEEAEAPRSSSESRDSEEEDAREEPDASQDRRASEESLRPEADDDRASSEEGSAGFREENSSSTESSSLPEEASRLSTGSAGEGPRGSSPGSETGSDGEEAEHQELESEEESTAPPRKKKAVTSDYRDYPEDFERSSSESSRSLDDHESEGGVDDVSDSAPVEMVQEISCRAPAAEEDDPGPDQLPVVSVTPGLSFLPLGAQGGPGTPSDEDSREVDVDASRNDTDMDHDGLCKSPSFSASFSPEADMISCFSFGDTRGKAGYMAAAEESLAQEFTPDASAWREEDLHFAQPATWPPPAPQLQPALVVPSDARQLADTVALTVMSSSFSRGVSLDQSPHGVETGGFTFTRGVSLEQEVNFSRMSSGGSRADGEDSLPSRQGSFVRGFSEDDLAATLMRAFEALDVERVPLRALLSALGRSDDEAEALAEALLPHLPKSEADGMVGCEELTRWLAMPQ